MGEIGSLTRDTVPELVLEASRPVIIDVWGERCAPCLALAPTFEELASRHAERGDFLKLEAPKNRMACVDLKVMALPTFLHYEDGREVTRLSGEIDEEDLERFVKQALGLIDEEGGEHES